MALKVSLYASSRHLITLEDVKRVIWHKAGTPNNLDDQADGYIVGSILWDYVNNLFYRCTNNSLGAAVWVVISMGGGSSTLSTSAAFCFDGHDGVITINESCFVRFPFDCTITGWSIASKDAGATLTFDVQKAAGTMPTSANTICGGNKPVLTAAQISNSSSLTGWTTAINSGDYVRVNLDACSVSTEATLFLHYTRNL